MPFSQRKLHVHYSVSVVRNSLVLPTTLSKLVYSRAMIGIILKYHFKSSMFVIELNTV